MKQLLILIFMISTVQAFCQIDYYDSSKLLKETQFATQYSQFFELTTKAYSIKQILLDQKKKNRCLFTLDSNFYKYSLSPYNKMISDSVLSAEKNCECTNGKSFNKYDVYLLNQLIYYRNSRLNIHNLLISPVCLEEFKPNYVYPCVWKYCFSSCSYDSIFHFKQSEKIKYLNLGKKDGAYNFYYTFAISPEGNKTLLVNKSLTRLLFEDIKKKKITAIDTIGNIIPSSKIFEYKNPKIEIPIFDSLGNHKGSKTFQPNPDLDKLYEFRINQQFYFDTFRQVLLSEVNYVDLYEDKFNESGRIVGKELFFRVYFVSPSNYKKSFLRKKI